LKELELCQENIEIYDKNSSAPLPFDYENIFGEFNGENLKMDVH
jgi:hypothetical protein